MNGSTDLTGRLYETLPTGYDSPTLDAMHPGDLVEVDYVVTTTRRGRRLLRIHRIGDNRVAYMMEEHLRHRPALRLVDDDLVTVDMRLGRWFELEDEYVPYFTSRDGAREFIVSSLATPGLSACVLGSRLVAVL